jgi:hypothetical protein
MFMEKAMDIPAEQKVRKTPSDDARNVVYIAEQELIRLSRQKLEITQRICGIKKMLSGMVKIFGESILSQELRTACGYVRSRPGRGFTHACRQVLMESRTPLRPSDASGELRQRFPELAERHKDLSASVATIFGRLVRYGEARSFVDDRGFKVWEWTTGQRPN